MLTPEQLARIVAVYRGVAGMPRIEYHDVAEPVVVRLAQPSDELRKTVYIPREPSTLSWIADANSPGYGTTVSVMQREYRMTDWVTTDYELTDADTPEPVLHLYGHRTIYVFQVWVEA